MNLVNVLQKSSIRKLGPAWKWVLAVLPLTIALEVLASTHPNLVMSAYANGLYLVLIRIQSFLWGWLPVSVAELAIMAIALLVLYDLAKAVRHPHRTWQKARTQKVAIALKMVAVLSVVYSSYIFMHGFLDYRKPLPDLLGLDMSPPGRHELGDLCFHLASRARRLRSQIKPSTIYASGRDFYEPILKTRQQGYANLPGHLAMVRDCRGAKPKPALFPPATAMAGISGIYVSWTGEPIYNPDVPFPGGIFTAMHEMAHNIGFSREDEANYVAYLACISHPDIRYQYAGTMRALIYTMNALRKNDRRMYKTAYILCGKDVLDDWRRMAAYHRKFRTRITKVSEKSNDLFLKARGQKHGVKTYNRLVNFLVATQRAGMDVY